MKSKLFFTLNCAIFFFFLFTVPMLHAQTIKPEGLLYKNEPASLDLNTIKKSGYLCIRYNNYWCVKQSLQNGPWLGSTGQDYRDHAIFADPVYAARAVVRILKTYTTIHKLDTVQKIMSRYAPSGDCIGSLGVPPNCVKGVNPTNSYALMVAQKIGVAPDQPLFLFARDGTLNTELMTRLLVAISEFELPQGYRASEAIVSRGIELFTNK